MHVVRVLVALFLLLFGLVRWLSGGVDPQTAPTRARAEDEAIAMQTTAGSHAPTKSTEGVSEQQKEESEAVRAAENAQDQTPSPERRVRQLCHDALNRGTWLASHDEELLQVLRTATREQRAELERQVNETFSELGLPRHRFW